MNRRALLAALGAGLAGIAGCSGSPDPEPTMTDASATTATPSAERTRTPPTEPAPPGPAEAATPSSNPLRLLSIDAPSVVEITRPVGYQFTVQNPDDAPHRFEPSASAREGPGEWSVLDRWESVELTPGEVRTFNSATFTSEYLTTERVRIDGLDATFSVEFVERGLPFRESHVDPLGRDVTVERIDLRDNFQYVDGGYERIAEAGEGRTWAMLSVKAINRGPETAEAPRYGGFSIRNGDERYWPLATGHDDTYQPVTLPEDGVASGVVVFNVPDGVSRDRLAPVWSETFEGGEVRVVWTPAS